MPDAASSWQLFHRLFQDDIRPYFGKLLFAASLMLVGAACMALNAWLMEPAVDEIFTGGDTTMLILVPLAVMLVALAKAAAGYFENWIMSGVGQRIIANMQIRLYEHLIRADLGYLNHRHSGELIATFLYDVTLLRDAVTKSVTGIAKDFTTVVALTIVMFIQDWKLACVTLFVLPAAALIVRQIGKRMRKASTRTQQETGRLNTHLTETISGAYLVKSYAAEAYESARAAAAVERRMTELLRGVRARVLASPLTEALSSVAVAAAILYGGWQAQSGDLTLGAFMSFLTALLMAYQPLKRLATLNAAMQEGLAAAQRIFAIFDTQPAIVEADDAKALQVASGHIRLSSVSFAYGNAVPALHEVDLEIAGGKTVALVGPSGAGKSSILNLIPRFYETTEGHISIDGQDIRQLTFASLRRAIAIVSQQVILFDDTIAANIAYGCREAGEDAIIAAAKAAAADDFIRRLPDGYQTRIGEQGMTLSGGQRQRLAIARAILKDAPILLLDEATAALDTESERQIQASLERLMHNRTTLVIAHRLSTVTAADWIYVLDQGRLIEQGGHEDLLAAQGLYAQLYRAQFADAPATQNDADEALAIAGADRPA